MDSSPSAGGAAELGATPHRTVGSAPGPAGSPAPLLAALAECAEPVPRSDPPRSESDYCVDILEDSHVTTAVGAVHAESFSSYGHHPNSAAEMEQLETALYSQISGAFQKRLRIKNLTLTPTPSTQQVFLLQSGDAGSVLVQSVSSLKLKRNSAESLHELKTMPVLSNSNLDWTFAQLPVQIATVGYAFPEHRPQNAGSKAKSIEMPHMATSGKTIQKFCQSSQCLRGLSPRPVRDTAAQADVGTISLASVHNPVVDGHAATSQVTGTESVQVISETHVGALVTVNDTNKAVEESYNGVQEEITIDEECVSVVNPVPETISYTTSLDMLVGILTEIQKITCQNQMVASGHQNCDLNISNDAIAVKRAENTACDLVSMSSLENLRQLESNASIYSFYLSSNEGSVKSVEPVLELKRNSRFTDDSVEVQPAASGCVTTEHVAVGVSITAVFDKEVSANLCEGHADMFTNVPSDVDRGSVPSSRSTLADDYRTPHSSTRTLATNNNIELPQIETRERRALISRDKTDLNEKCFTTLSIRKIEDIEKESLIASRELRYCVKNIDWDPMFKIKRDLLVSMYSILVLTVFAALSFPELLMFES